MTNTGKPFLYRAGTYLPEITLTSRRYEAKPSTDITLDFHHAGCVNIPADNMNTLLVAIVERMFDEGTLDMGTADRLAYLAGCVLADREMPVSSLHAEGWTDPWMPPAVAEFRAEQGEE